MKKLITIAALILIISFNSQAQETKLAKPASFSWSQKTMDYLGLPQEQQQKITALKKEYEPKIKAVQSDTALTEEEKKQKVKELYAVRNAQIDKLLTKEEKQKVKEMKQKMKEQNSDK